MAQDNQDQSQAYNDYYSDINIKLKDIEEKQNIIKDRLLLIGENLVAEKQETDKKVLEIKNQFNEIQQENKKLKLAIQRILEAQEGFARKNELKILEKQFKMFQPLEFARLKDVETMINKKLKKK
jgi:hypothetical protein